ncbi:hypothetical protein ACEPAH_1654 [Sanghuangporus vaninii]
MSSKFNVAICGGGVAGLTTALAISHFSAGRRDILVDLYEALPSFTEVGAGIGMYRRTWKIMKSLGLEEELRKLAKIPFSDDEMVPKFQTRKSNQAEGITFHHPMIPFGAITFHRADFQQCFVNHLDTNLVRSHFSKRLIGYVLPFDSEGQEASRRITLKFKDGSEAYCDVLIGADGIHSATRHAMLELVVQELEKKGSEADKNLSQTLRSPGKLDPIWTGSIAYRALIPREHLEVLNPSHRAFSGMMNVSLNRLLWIGALDDLSALPMQYTGHNKHLIVYPIMKGKLVNVVAFVSHPEKEGSPYNDPWVISSEQTDLVAAYEGWEAEVQQLVQCMDKPSRWAIHSLRELRICTHDRVAIIGDAAHAMTPHQGAGAGVAIEDAYILGALLTHPQTTLYTLPMALKVYETVCLRHANKVQQRSRLHGQLYEFAVPPFSSLAGRTILDNGECQDDVMGLKAVGDAIMENRNWGWETDADDNLAEAISSFEIEVMSGQGAASEAGYP